MAAPEGYTKLGNVGYADKGVYSADATYNKYNAVYHEGSTYVALKDNLHGVTPADGVNWRYMAKGFTEASADAITVIDTSGIIDGTKNKKTILQTFLDKVGDFIINKAVTNDALMLKLADYVAKTDIVQVESTATNKVPSSAYLKQVKDSIDSNLVSKLGTGSFTFTRCQKMIIFVNENLQGITLEFIFNEEWSRLLTFSNDGITYASRDRKTGTDSVIWTK